MTDVIHDAQPEARRLMEHVLREGSSLAEEYPLIFDERFDGRSLAIGHGGRVESACTLLARDFHLAGTQVRGGMIGSVSTAPDMRRRGLATRTLIEAEAALQMQGCAFVLLWGEDPNFYVTRGYCPAGVEYDFVLTDAEYERLPSSDAVRELAPGDHAAVRALYHQHSTRVERTEAETTALLACPGMSSLVLERDGVVVAYALRGRGADLQGAIHEWGGAIDDMLAIARRHVETVLAEGGQGLVLMAPDSATDLRVRMATLGIEEHVGILGLGKVLDRPAAARLLDTCLGDQGTCRVVSTAEGERFRIEGPEDAGEIDDHGALALLMPTVELRPPVEAFLTRFGFADTRLPLAPFVWGLDSI